MLRGPRSPFLVSGLVIGLVLFTSIVLFSNLRPGEREFGPRGSHGGKGTAVRSNIYDVKNETLGFSRIFVVSLPERTDKRDALSTTASFTGISFDWVDGVDGEKIPGKAIPEGWPKGESTGALGCWRGHMNAVQKIVKERIATVLIMEDDVDWDVTLKTQLVEFARGARYLQGLDDESPNRTAVDSLHSPYGDNWDLLWIGTCGSRNREDQDQRYWVIRNDPTAVPSHLRGWDRRQPNLSPSALGGNHTRVVYEPVRGLCMYGYALSLRGAQKLLYHQTMAGKASLSDRGLQQVCNDRYLGYKCIAPYPTLISTHKAAGATSKDSDREDTKTADGGFRQVGETNQIVYSTRLNLERLLMGNQLVQSQWPHDTMSPEIYYSTDLPQGHGVYVAANQYQPVERPG